MTRWLVVLLAATALVVTPLAVQARRAQPVDLAADVLAARVSASAGVGWSGRVQSEGTLQLPADESFATLGQLLGESVDLRAWWRGPADWRVDRIRGTGETDLFRQGRGQVRWVFESERATFSPVSKIRLPDASDVLPPVLGRSLLQGARPDELAPLPSRRIAGVDAAGLRLTPQDPAATVAHVDVWAEPASGLPLRVDLYGSTNARPVLSTAVTDLTLGTPDRARTRFGVADGVTLAYEESVDVAAAANALATFDLPTRLAGLPVRGGADPGAVGVYGRGPTTMIVLPLRGSVARPLRARLQDSGTATSTVEGTLAPTGPVTVLVTPRRAPGASFLLAGTVSPETARQAARELLAAG